MALSKDLPKPLHIYGQTRKMREETTAEKQPSSVRAVASHCAARIFGAGVDGVMVPVGLPQSGEQWHGEIPGNPRTEESSRDIRNPH